KTLASGGDVHTVRLWDLGTGKVVHTLTGHTERIRSLVFSPDGQLLASGSLDTTITLWDPATGKEVHTLSGHSRSRSLIRFSTDGRTLASESCNEHAVRLWDIDNKKELTSSTHPAHLDGLAMHPGGNMLAAGLIDGTVHFWDLASGLARERVVRVGPPGKPI